MVQTALLIALFVLGSIGLAWLAYFTMRAIAGAPSESETRDLAGSVIFRVAALHGLVLALVFAQEMIRYQELRESLITEATATADLYYDVARYGGPNVDAMQATIADYIRFTTVEEWQSLADEDRLLQQGWNLRETVYLAVLNLEPTSSREESLREHMLHKLQLIAEMRQKRELMARFSISWMFWFAAVAGIILVAIPYFIFSPTPLHLVLLSVYGAFTGVVMLIIYAFADPFAEPGALPPTAFEQLLETQIGDS